MIVECYSHFNDLLEDSSIEVVGVVMIAISEN